jgi:hypothetical protein
MQDSISAAVTAIYDACSAFSFDGVFDDSYDRLAPEVASRISSSPLREIRPDDAWDLFRGVWEHEEGFKHFLPRLLELAVLPWTPYHYPDLAAVLEHARRRGLFHLPSLRAPIERLLDSLWAFLHSNQAPPEQVEDILCGSAWLYDSLLGPLSAWLQAEGSDAAVTIASYVLLNAEALNTHRRLANGDRWEHRPGLETEVCEWLRSEAVWKRLREFAASSEAPPQVIAASAFLKQLHTAPVFR